MIVEGGGKALFVQCNVTRATEVEALVDKTVAYYGRLDCAFNNAGIEEEHLPLADADEALFDRIINVNVKGAGALQISCFMHSHAPLTLTLMMRSNKASSASASGKCSSSIPALLKAQSKRP